MIFCCYSTLTTIVFPRLAPVAVCSLVAARIAGVDDVLGAIKKLGLYILTTLCGLLGHALAWPRPVTAHLLRHHSEESLRFHKRSW